MREIALLMSTPLAVLEVQDITHDDIEGLTVGSLSPVATHPVAMLMSSITISDVICYQLLVLTIRNVTWS
jgi:hypothetical protein